MRRVQTVRIAAMNDLGRLLIGVGALLLVAGVVVLVLGRVNIPLGRLPGDVTWRGKNTVVYFPIVTCIAISVVLSLIMWIVNHLRR
ncbi:MAG TPA: DUF2905 domain-containing protein [candidate division Zixibacteria bacterium]|nr:DUF2905 domain-containing protein [candidate division Zixibacteria bacterium]